MLGLPDGKMHHSEKPNQMTNRSTASSLTLKSLNDIINYAMREYIDNTARTTNRLMDNYISGLSGENIAPHTRRHTIKKEALLITLPYERFKYTIGTTEAQRIRGKREPSEA